MNAKILAALLLAMSLGLGQGHAADAKVQTIVSKLKLLNGKRGVSTSSFDQWGTGKCTIEVQEDSSALVSVTFEDTGFYFTPVAHVFENAQALSSDTLLISDSSNRPGGDACGDIGGATSYKKTLKVTDREVVISEKFRCAFELFKKYELTTKCKIK